MNVLLVDDQVLFRELLADMLGRAPDCTVVGQASNTSEAVALSRSLKPEIILMDLGLPDGTGLDATRAILRELPETRIVFLTVHANDEDLLAAIRLGAKGYLLKDTSASTMLTYLRGVLHGDVAVSPAIAGRLFNSVARQFTSNPASLSLLKTLTSREQEILRELIRGASNREIAEKLIIAENTVKNHLRAILSKLGVHNRRDAVAIFRRDGS